MISRWWTDKNLVTIDRSSNSISHHVSKIVIIDRISRLGQVTLMICQKLRLIIVTQGDRFASLGYSVHV